MAFAVSETKVGQGTVAETSLEQCGRPGYTLTSGQLLKQEHNTIVFVLVARLLRLWSSLDKEGGWKQGPMLVEMSGWVDGFWMGSHKSA